jgi:hypothetical protein
MNYMLQPLACIRLILKEELWRLASVDLQYRELVAKLQ